MATEATAELIRHALRTHADPSRAAGQQAYMKSAMPFLGVTVPETRRLTRAAITGSTDAAGLLDLARSLWDGATHREERYAALAVLASPALKGDRRVAGVAEHAVRTGRWWDFTDEIAHRIADLHDADPEWTAALVRTWSTDDDFWMRRVAILSQLGRRDRVDQLLLAAVIEPNTEDSEFFIRKVIGWALRDHARVDPDWVRAFVRSHELSPLSRREALKHLSGDDDERVLRRPFD